MCCVTAPPFGKVAASHSAGQISDCIQAILKLSHSVFCAMEIFRCISFKGFPWFDQPVSYSERIILSESDVVLLVAILLHLAIKQRIIIIFLAERKVWYYYWHILNTKPRNFVSFFYPYEYHVDLWDDGGQFAVWCKRKEILGLCAQTIQPNSFTPAMHVGIVQFYNLIPFAKSLTMA